MFQTPKEFDDQPRSYSATSHGHIETYLIERAADLIQKKKRTDWVNELPSLAAATAVNYKLYYLPVIHNFAEFVQNLPETKQGFYSHNGGFLDHGLERTVRALQLHQNYLSAYKEEEETQEQIALWNYAIFTASLLFDVGKLATKLLVTLRQDGQRFRDWNPFEGSMLKFSVRHYSYEFAKENLDVLRRQVTPLLAKQLMPDLGFSWLSSDKDVLSAWFALLQEEYRQVSAHMTVIPLADAQLSETYFQNYEKDLVRKIKTLLKDSAQAFKSLDVSKKPSTLFSKEPIGAAGETFVKRESMLISTVAGEAFLSWLKRGIASGKLSVNMPNSGIHVVGEGILLLEKVFQMFAKENPVYGDWHDIKRQFEQLDITKQMTGQQQAFRQYAIASEFKVLTEATLVANMYMVFLHNQNIPAVNPNIVPVEQEAKLPRLEDFNPPGKPNVPPAGF